MKKLIHKVKINKGKLILLNKEKFNNYLLSLEGEFDLVIKKPVNQRTIDQNKYFHGVVLKVSAECMGFDLVETKAYLKAVLGYFKIYEIDGQRFTELESTSKMSTKRLSEFIEEIKKFIFNNYQVNIPNANEIDLDSYQY